MSQEQNPGKSPWEHDTPEGRTEAWAKLFRAHAAAMESGAVDTSYLHPLLKQLLIAQDISEAKHLEGQLRASPLEEGGK